MTEINGAAALAAAEMAARVNPEVIAQLEEALKRAKVGEIVSVAVVGVTPLGAWTPIIVGPRLGDLLTGVTVVQAMVANILAQAVAQQHQRPGIMRAPAGAI